ncbi:hypothetical protein AMJ71_02675 [candidate division TA06 bacterium SM1_40]|jgi:hypothetical protein|uniref:FlgD/Vpr Ig-like domain-containing protein n=2 Tax=Bacteria division TA06 TaxID=1156500 RepID=A0A0S8JLN9_UNCT6|nr:MAG: hypothetical protein AMJ82_01750 [candidate division TA06 bacterium SM23_40]KPL10568.1 MAG: hypothetical protein AMJ71_02675 [candidate division TA06 bacterium SM1_40]
MRSYVWVVLVAVAVGAALGGPATAQVDTLYAEYFTDGGFDITWVAAFEGDNMDVTFMAGNPSGDGWVGFIINEIAAPVGLTYSGEDTLADYSIEAQIYTRVDTTISTGSYNGILARFDTTEAGTELYYSMVSDFDSDRRLRLRLYDGSMFPIVIRDWVGGEIPGGAPTEDGWHKFELAFNADTIWAYYDDIELPDSPFIEGTLPAGHFGVYVFNFAGTDTTYCDDIIVTAAGPPVSVDTGPDVPLDLSQGLRLLPASPNPFVGSTKIGYVLPPDAVSRHVSLRVYNVAGQAVATLVDQEMAPGRHYVIWDGRDHSGRSVANGIYLVHLVTDRGVDSEKVVLVR